MGGGRAGVVELGAAMSCACVAELHGVSIMPDLLKKKLWKGQSGERQGFRAYLELSHIHLLCVFWGAN
tara:strand:+ start:243 stop:446 length:204 start_codon:yes stop_codon:yes gene_type:complete